ncbi:MAG TPA: nucleotidyltransferase domain-containing protein [Bacillota bacterium]
MINRQILQKLTSYFLERGELSAAYLFGSHVKGKNRPHSDLDLAVLFDPKLDVFQRFDNKLQIANDLEESLNVKIDLVDLESADLFFIHQIMLDKLLIYEKDRERRVEFEVKARRDFFDRQHFYDLYYREALKRIEGRS